MTTLDAATKTVDFAVEVLGLHDLQRQKEPEMIGRSVFPEPLPESLEHKCRRLVALVKDIMAETDAIGMMADRSYVAGPKVRVQVSSSDFARLFAGMHTQTQPTLHSEYVERSIPIGGVIFFALVHESAAELAARMLKDLPEEERHRLLESLK